MRTRPSRRDAQGKQASAATAAPGPATPRRTPRPTPSGGPRPSARPPRAQIVERRRRRRVAAQRQWRLALAVTGLLSVVAVFGAAAFHVVLVQSEFRLERLDADAAAAQQRYEQLRLEVARLGAPERIVAAAQQRLGMVPPGQVVYLTAPSQTAEPPGPDISVGGWAEVKPHLAARP